MLAKLPRLPLTLGYKDSLSEGLAKNSPDSQKKRLRGPRLGGANGKAELVIAASESLSLRTMTPRKMTWLNMG